MARRRLIFFGIWGITKGGTLQKGVHFGPHSFRPGPPSIPGLPKHKGNPIGFGWSAGCERNQVTGAGLAALRKKDRSRGYWPAAAPISRDLIFLWAKKINEKFFDEKKPKMFSFFKNQK